MVRVGRGVVDGLIRRSVWISGDVESTNHRKAVCGVGVMCDGVRIGPTLTPRTAENFAQSFVVLFLVPNDVCNPADNKYDRKFRNAQLEVFA